MAKQKHIGWKSFALAFALSLAVLGIISAGIMLVTNLMNPKSDKPQSVAAEPGYEPRAEDNLTILLMGCRDNTEPPDRYTLIRFYPEERVVRIVPVPKELEATVNIKTGTLPQLCDYGGVQMACEGVRNALFVKVDRYVKYTDAEFTEWVDLFGGLELEVEQTVEYQSEAGSKVRLVEGLQLLNGKKLLDYLNSPLVAGLSDSERLKREADLLAEGINQRLVNSISSRADSIFEQFTELMQTNISSYDYTMRKQAIGYLAQSEEAKAAVQLIDGSYTGNKDAKKFTPSPAGKEMMQNWFEPYEG